MKKNNLFSIILISSLVVFIILCGTVFAYMFKQAADSNNEFIPAVVSCEVDEEFDGEYKSSIKVKNTGNIDSYIRLRLVSYWIDSEGNIAPLPSKMPDIQLGDGWIAGSNDTYYYKTKVLPKEFTDNLLTANVHLEKDSNGNKQVLEVFAEAIQGKPADAVTDSWKVTLDSNGNITSAP